MNPQLGLERLVRFYETISPQALAEIGTVYAANAHFKDPFNDVTGLADISAIFAHMFVQVDGPRFVVNTRIMQGTQAFLSWEFRYRMKRYAREEQYIRGATHLVFNEAGLVTEHRDYWDAAEELYEKLPILGALMRWFKRSARR
jgi:steroid delta-isomerase